MGCGIMGMSTHLTQLLQGLCSDGLWRYAVFWSFKSKRNRILTLGDAYVKNMIKDSQIGALCAGPIVTKNKILSSPFCNKRYPLCPIDAALLRMSNHSYHLGEEIIGQIALAERHCWTSANELCSTSMYKYHEDWKIQFEVGIETILLIPVIPNGVLQLGSLDTVFENSALVALIKDLFHKLYDNSTPISHDSFATGSGYSDTLRQPTATLSIDPPDVLPHYLIDVIESSAQHLTPDHLSVPHPFTVPEFPILGNVTIGFNRTSLTVGSNGPLDASETLGYENLYGFTLTDMAHGYQEHTHGRTLGLNDDAVVSNSSIRSEFHNDLMEMSREEHEFFLWHSRLKHQEPTSNSLLQLNGDNADFYLHLETDNYAELDLDGQELPPTPMNEGFMSCATTSLPMEINKTIAEEFIDRTVEVTEKRNSSEIKRRCRNIELQRTRPRDRQLIQDRMKELRELIPNASKCSIDALLDKTITYMLFLRSVSEKAEKIHNTLDNKESPDETKKQFESFPLRVEELTQPGHLLIEILCKDYELFLEIAHVFKGLEVSILKGVLEHRLDELWAHFVVEASEGFNQMQILCPLIHLLHKR